MVYEKWMVNYFVYFKLLVISIENIAICLSVNDYDGD